ncbi:MAG: flagellar motor switch protein FliN [Gammaproteobacteria bacterium]|nr:flagellar motor switch protein FliN [Gammaproteobacteria bacterium]
MQIPDAAAADDDWDASRVEPDATDSPRTNADTADEPRQAPLENLRDRGAGTGDEVANLESILDIPVTMSVEIGSTKVSIRNLLQLNQGSVVELDRLAGESLDVLVNGTLVAHGEVVVVNEKFGIRLTDVVSAQERVRKLR